MRVAALPEMQVLAELISKKRSKWEGKVDVVFSKFKNTAKLSLEVCETCGPAVRPLVRFTPVPDMCLTVYRRLGWGQLVKLNLVPELRRYLKIRGMDLPYLMKAKIYCDLGYIHCVVALRRSPTPCLLSVQGTYA